MIEMRIIILVTLLLGSLIASSLTLSDCYLKISSTATLEYNVENVSANTIILDISSFRYKLADSNYIVVTLGYPPLNLYGFAILNRNNTIFFYSIRGDQNHWHRVEENITGNIVVKINVINGSLIYELLSRGILIDTYKTNISFESLELRNLIITVASPYNSKNSWLMFKELILTADNNIVLEISPNNTTLTNIKEEGLIYPDTNRIELVCLKPVVITKTVTYNNTVTTINSFTTTSIIETTKTITTTLYSTLTTSITETTPTTITMNNTITITETITNTYTVTSTSETATTIEPYLVVSILMIVIGASITLLLRRR